MALATLPPLVWLLALILDPELPIGFSDVQRISNGLGSPVPDNASKLSKNSRLAYTRAISTSEMASLDEGMDDVYGDLGCRIAKVIGNIYENLELLKS